MSLRRLLPLTSPLILLGLGAAPARADIDYSFTALGETATFSLPNNPTVALTGTNFFQVDNVVVTITGEGMFTGDVDFYNSAGMGGAASGDNVLHGDTLFTGTLMNPTMLTGNFALSGKVTPDPDGPVEISGTLIATNAPIPEPSSLALLFTGIGTIAGALALRKRALTTRK